MKKREVINEYSNGELTVVWEPKKCIHSSICVNTLPNVYNPNKRPWIKPDKATTEELKSQIDTCPSGALSYYMNKEVKKETESADIKVKVLPNGPLLVFGNIQVTDKDGNAELKSKTTAFCRCGVSRKKPYCDGSHMEIDFKD